MPPPSERVAIVIGGGSGIGAACAERLARDGYRVLVTGRTREPLDATCRRIQEAGGSAAAETGTIASRADCDRWAHSAITRWGRIDVLVANAGSRAYGTIEAASDADWADVVDVNLKGVAHACASVLPAMRAQCAGAIVVVSSTHALAGRGSMPLYDATKAAVLSLTRSLAIAHGAKGIRVNAVCPGYTVTAFHETNAAAQGVSPEALRTRAAGYGVLGRAAEPEEIAAAIAFLAGSDASNITGQSLMVDGGLSIHSR